MEFKKGICHWGILDTSHRSIFEERYFISPFFVFISCGTCRTGIDQVVGSRAVVIVCVGSFPDTKNAQKTLFNTNKCVIFRVLMTLLSSLFPFLLELWRFLYSLLALSIYFSIKMLKTSVLWPPLTVSSSSTVFLATPMVASNQSNGTIQNLSLRGIDTYLRSHYF